MGKDENSLIKHREINFCTLRPDNQAQDAVLVLTDIEGIERLVPHSPQLLVVSYDVTAITLQAIEELLTELGFHLSSKLLFKLKRALYYYTEETERINLGIEGGVKECKQLFVNRYDRLPHGCRDELPEHWRNYR